MFGSSRRQPHSRVEYESLQDEDDDNRRDSINSNSPILDKLSIDAIQEFDRDSAASEREGVFATDSGLETFRRPIEGYEGAHRYDPTYRWSKEDEQKVVRKIDKWVCSWVCLMFFALQLDRGNITQALADNMLDDLGLNTNDYNYGQAIFYFSFLMAELPSQLISKWIGPDRWIPIQMVSWSLIASCQAFLSGRTSFFVCRALIGMVEGGFIPDNVLYLSYFYTGTELPRRMSYFWTSSQMTNIVSAFLAYGILHLRGALGLAGWRWLFGLEGILTGIVGILSFFYLPPSPTQTAQTYTGKPWFTVHEEKIMVNRILRDDPSKGDMHNREALSLGMIKDCLTDWHMLPVYILAISWGIPNIPMTQYLTLKLRDIGFTTFQTNLLTIPAYLLFIAQLLFWTYISEKFNQRFLVGLVSQLWALPLLVVLEYMPADADTWFRYTITVLMVGHPYVHAILVAITSRNAGTVRTRTVASALYNMLVQFASIIAQQIYRDEDRPLYRRGNKILIVFCVYNFALFVGAKLFYKGVNKKRTEKWDAMTLDEKRDYLNTTKDQGNKRLDFRFAH